MRYVSTTICNSISVDGIFTVLKPNLAKPNPLGEAHNFPEIIYIESGKHYVILDGVEYELYAGEMMMFGPNAHHVAKCATEAAASIISFESDSSIIAELSNKIIPLNESQKKIFSNIIDDGLKCFEPRATKNLDLGGMILKPGADEYTLQKIKKQLEFFLIDIYNSALSVKPTAKSEKDFVAVCAFLEKNIGAQLSLSEIAAKCSMSVSKLKLLFRKNCGMGVIDYFIKIKIKSAKGMIAEGRLNFTEISEELGFSSLHYFSRLFKKTVGISPSEYAKQNAKAQ